MVKNERFDAKRSALRMRRLNERASKQILIFFHFGTSKTLPGE